MSQLSCPCGHVIKDTVWPRTYDSGDIICDMDQEHYFEQTAHALAELIEATQRGERIQWMKKYLPHMDDRLGFDRPDHEIIEDYMSTFSFYVRVIEQCEKCGRLLIQQSPGINDYRSFKPEGEWQGILTDVGPQGNE